jgi:hypothetical protein
MCFHPLVPCAPVLLQTAYHSTTSFLFILLLSMLALYVHRYTAIYLLLKNGSSLAELEVIRSLGELTFILS